MASRVCGSRVFFLGLMLEFRGLWLRESRLCFFFFFFWGGGGEGGGCGQDVSRVRVQDV